CKSSDRSNGSSAMVKNVIVNLTVDADRDTAAEYAVSLAKAFDAHLTGIGIAYEAVIPGSVFGGVVDDLAHSYRAATEKAARAAAGNFDTAARKAGVSAESHVFHLSHVDAAQKFGAMARRFDLSVVAQVEPDKLPGREPIIEAALFASGRPVLVVPYIQREALSLDRVMVCWDGSRAAARAVGDAMPFLARAKAVEVVIVSGDPGKSDEIP